MKMKGRGGLPARTCLDLSLEVIHVRYVHTEFPQLEVSGAELLTTKTTGHEPAPVQDKPKSDEPAPTRDSGASEATPNSP
jgi:hypothetical protein